MASSSIQPRSRHDGGGGGGPGRLDRRDGQFGRQAAQRGGVVAGVAGEHRPRARELDPGVVVGQQRRAGGEAGQPVALGDQQREHPERVARAHAGQVGDRLGAAAPDLGQRGDPRAQRLGAADEQDVAVADQPDGAVGEDRGERGDDRPQVLGADVVGVRPLAQHAARGETRLGRGEELAGEERRDPGHPRVRRLRDDDVVLRAAEHQVGAAVADDQPRARIGQRPRVLGLEEARGLDHLRRDLEHVDALERMAERRPERHAAAEAEDRRLRGAPGGAAAARAPAAAGSACRRRSTRRPCRRWPATSCRPRRAPRRWRWRRRGSRAAGRRPARRRANRRSSSRRTCRRRSTAVPGSTPAAPRWPRRRWLRPRWPTSGPAATARSARPERWPPARRPRRGRAACRTARGAGSGRSRRRARRRSRRWCSRRR